jgi:anti-sigma B factor antagonist
MRRGDVVLRLEVGAGRAIVAVIGRIDAEATASLRESLRRALDAQATHVVVDLARLDAVDAAALRVVAAAHRRLCADGGDLTLWRPSAAAAAALRENGLDQTVRVVASEEADPFQLA